MRIAVVGTGYVGLVSGACLSEKGHHVICVDNDAHKIQKINNGVSPIYEDGLDALLKRNIGKRLSASTDLRSAINKSDISLIAVGTPFNGSIIDLSYVRQVAQEIGECLSKEDDYHVVIVKSTVVPGTSDDVVKPLLEKYSKKIAGRDFGIGMNPEFLREGLAVDDFMNPDRIVLGGSDDLTHSMMAKLYEPFGDIDTIFTNNKTAEMIKYTSNSLLATLISFSNEVGNLCSTLGAIDAKEVMTGVHLDKRISPILENGQRILPEITSYIEVGSGFGGSCLPKDVNALISHGDSVNQPMSLLKSVMLINKAQPLEIIKLLVKHYPDINDLKIAILGLAFKPGTDDMRESPAISIIDKIVELGGKVNAYDPIAEGNAKVVLSNNITFFNSFEDAVRDSEVVILLTSWPEFQNLPQLIKSLNINPLVIDGRRMLSKNDISRYEGIGN